MSSSDLRPPDAFVPRSEPSASEITLRIKAASPFTEIRVLDARFEPVPLAANTGAVHVQVSPGLYEVGFRSEGDWQTQHVIAEPNSAPILVQQKAPFADTKWVDPAGAGPAEVAHPPAATVVVVLRHGQSGSADPERLSVELISADGDQPLSTDLTPDSGAKWCFPATPGHWRLRINEIAARQPFEIAVTVAPGYTALVDAPLLSGDGELRVDLEKLRFRLHRLGGPGETDPELTSFEEAALAALGTGRTLFGPEIEQLIDRLADDKATNPMLGILAAHLCDRGADGHLAFRRRLLDRLEKLTGGPGVNPDVAVLRLGLASRLDGLTGNEAPIRFPPILAASWRMLLETSRRYPRLIPAGSLCERIADRLWSSRLWTAWTAPPLHAKPVAPGARGAEGASAAGAEAVDGGKIAELLAHPQIREWFRDASRTNASGTDGVDWEGDAVSAAEAAVATALFPVASTEEQQPLLQRWSDRLYTLSEGAPRGDPASMADQLGLPRSTVERALSSLAGKLDVQANAFRIKP